MLPLPVAIPCGWQALKIQEITAPGDWEWSAISKQWVPVLVRAWVCYGETRIRRMSFRNGEKVRVFREDNAFPYDLRLEVHTILSSDASGKQLLRCLAGTLVSIDSDLLQPVYDLGNDPGRPIERWKKEDIVTATMHPQDNPNLVPYIATPEPEPVVKESLTTDVCVKGLRKTVLYIAGPMRGIAWFNYPLFDRVAKELRDAGNEVISPADEDRKVGFDPFANPEYRIADACTFPSEASFESFDKTVRRCLDAVLRCDEIVLLPGWEKSSGALAELTLAMWLGKRVRDVRIDDQDRITYLGQWMGLACLAMQLHDYHLEVEVPYPTGLAEQDDDDNDILAEASRITRGSRQAQYGPPDEDFRRTAGMWSALFAAKLKEGVTFEPRDVALAMILLKTSRETHQRKRDNWVDIAGYASCGSRCN